MKFIEYLGEKPALLALNAGFNEMEIALKALADAAHTFTYAKRELKEADFVKALEQATFEERQEKRKWQVNRRVIYQARCNMLRIRLSAAESALVRLDADLSALGTLLTTREEPWFESHSRDVADNNRLIGQSLSACARQQINRWRRALSEEVGQERAVESVDEAFSRLPERCSIYDVIGSEQARNFYLWLVTPLPLELAPVESCAQMTALNELLIKIQTGEAALRSDLYTLFREVKGCLNEANYARQLEESLDDRNRFQHLEQMQQVHRSNYSSFRTACHYQWCRLEEEIQLLCELFSRVRNLKLPDDPDDCLRFKTNCLVVYSYIYRTYNYMRAQRDKLYEDATNGRGQLDQLYVAAENCARREVDWYTRWLSISPHTHEWKWSQCGITLMWMQLFNNYALTPNGEEMK